VIAAATGQAGATGTDLSFRGRREARIRREGPILESILFEGNETFDRDALLSYMALQESGFFSIVHFKRRLMERDLENLERFYMTQGFLAAEMVVEDEKPSADSLRVEVLVGVYEGPRWSVSDVVFDGNLLLSENDLVRLTELHAGSPLLSNELESDRRAVLDAYARRSHLDARVIQTVARDDAARTASITYRIFERERATIGSIDVAGDDKTREFVIEREFEFAPGDSFDPERIGETQARIYRTGLFHSVWIEPAREDSLKALKRLDVTVSERPSGQFDCSVGYAALDGFAVAAGVANRNVQGQAISLGVEGKYSEFERGGEVSIGDPWFTGRPVAVDVTAGYSWNDEESYLAETTGAAFVLSKRIGAAVTVEGGYEFDRTIVFEAPDGGGGGGTNYNSNVFSAASYDTRDDILNGKRGMLARVRVDLASSRFGGTNDFARYEIAWRGYRKIGHGRVGALSMRLGWMKPQGDGSDIPVNERFFTGGDGSVRGFDRNSLSPTDDTGDPKGGRALIGVRAEVRFPVWKRLRAVAFADAGQVFDDFKAVKLAGLAIGAGAGLRYETRVGVLRFDVATPASEKGAPKYYFGVGQAF
jgi:outer membrane protein insertion porin family